MTTLSKEDVVRWADECVFDIMQADEYHAENEVIDSGNRWITDKMMAFAALARADLVAENERLKATPPDQRQDLHCVVSDIAAECRELRDQLTATSTALAAAEADNERLRAWAEYQRRPLCMCFAGCDECDPANAPNIDDLLSKPRDDSALREMIAGVYEECAKACEDDAKGWTDYSCEMAARDCVDAIRALAEKAKGECK